MNRNKKKLFYKVNFANKKVIEIGSGLGRFTIKYLSLAKSIVCVDTDTDANFKLKSIWTEQNFPAKINFINEEIQHFDTSERFDIAIFSHSY